MNNLRRALGPGEKLPEPHPQLPTFKWAPDEPSGEFADAFRDALDSGFQHVLDDKFSETSELESKGYSLVNELRSPQKELLQDYLRHVWIQDTHYKTLVADLKMGKIPPFLQPFIVAAT